LSCPGGRSRADENRLIHIKEEKLARPLFCCQLRKTYGVAFARGATNTGCMPEPERLYGTLRLLTLATLRLPDLAMIAQLMHIDAAADDPVVLCAAHDVAGGALRLAHRALETHGRDLGGPGCWYPRRSRRASDICSSSTWSHGRASASATTSRARKAPTPDAK
jgi:hypothetical protein